MSLKSHAWKSCRRVQVILAFMGEKGKVYEQIRQRGCDITIGQREPEVAGVAAPYALAGA